MTYFFKRNMFLELIADICLIRKFRRSFRSFKRIGHIPLYNRDIPVTLCLDGASEWDMAFLFWLNRHWLGFDLSRVLSDTAFSLPRSLGKTGLLQASSNEAALVKKGTQERQNVFCFPSGQEQAGKGQALPLVIRISGDDAYFRFGEPFLYESETDLREKFGDVIDGYIADTAIRIEKGEQCEIMLKGRSYKNSPSTSYKRL